MSEHDAPKQDPFAIVPAEVVRDSRLTAIQLRVLITILTFRNKHTHLINPSRAAIAKRCGYGHGTISRATAALEQMGWLTKRGSGGSGPVRYEFHVPDGLDRCPIPTPVPDPDTGARSEHPPVPDPDTTGARSGHGTGARSGHTEQTREQKKEQTKEQKGRARKQLDYAKWPAAVDPQARADWEQHRKAMRAPANQTVVNQVGKELHKCAALGIDPNDALAEAMSAGWRGLKADWIANRVKPAQGKEAIQWDIAD